MPSFAWFVLSAVAEISGCYAFWSWLRLDRTPFWVLPGLVSLALFAFFLTRVDVGADAAGRAYAAYGGIYITASLVWLWAVEGLRPDRWDLAGALVCLAGTSMILFGPHRA